MSTNIIYFITGANRGIGLELTRTLLLRTGTTIVATVRSDNTDISDLQTLQKAKENHLIILPLAFSPDPSATSVHTLKERLASNGITKLDILIINAGAATSFKSIKDTTMAELLHHFEINTLLPISIYQTLRPLLLDSSDGDYSDKVEKKVIYISSILGSIGGIQEDLLCLAYGISKVGGNFLMKKIHLEEESLVSLAIHPGFVKTGNGQAFADSIGLAEPPMSVEESANGVLAQIDAATKSTKSGCFLSYNGSEIPW